MPAAQTAETNENADFRQLTVLDHVEPNALEALGIKYTDSGKICDKFALDDRKVFIRTDRVSAFDRVLGTVPGKGQILTEQSAWWFEQMKDIIPNHVLAIPDPNVTVGKKLTPVPVEVIVRGVITGSTDTSLWVNYEKAVPDADGYREVYGIKFPPGLKKNDVLPEAVITPTTKGEKGKHDEKISEKKIVESGLVTKERWETIRTAALAMFARAQVISREKGFILVDTKIEFGVDENGNVYVMDELFTGDSSRFWLASTMEKRLAAGEEPENYDKEYLRLAYEARGYKKEGTNPDQVPLDIQQELLRRYVAVYEALTGKIFEYEHDDVIRRIRANMGEYVAHEAAASLEITRRSPQVVVIMGSKSDEEHAIKIRQELDKFGVPCELRIASAHKNPEDVLAMMREYDADHTRRTVYIAVAGLSNALGGVMAWETTSPVISCPPKGELVDLFSSIRMPSGMTASLIVEPKSAALFAVEIFAVSHPELRDKLKAYEDETRRALRQKDKELQITKQE